MGLANSPPWHTDRGGLRRLANWASRCIAALAKVGKDVSISSRGEIAELRSANGGGSSTMPHKSNPVTAEALQSIVAMALACEAVLSASAVHAEERDGVYWPVEWALMPPLLEAVGAAFDHAQRLLEALVVDADSMRARVEAVPDVRSEAAVFALAPKMGRVAAGQVVADALRTGRSLKDVLVERRGQDARDAISDESFLRPAAETARQIFAERFSGDAKE